MPAINILGLEIPDAGRLFFVALAFHVLAGVTCVFAGALAATARKRSGFRQDAHLFGIVALAFALAMLGWWARRKRRPRWPRQHAIGTGGSYIVLFTGFYVDNGPQLPLWNNLPHWTYWVTPAAIGIPLIWLAWRRFHTGINTRPPSG